MTSFEYHGILASTTYHFSPVDSKSYWVLEWKLRHIFQCKGTFEINALQGNDKTKAKYNFRFTNAHCKCLFPLQCMIHVTNIISIVKNPLWSWFETVQCDWTWHHKWHWYWMSLFVNIYTSWTRARSDVKIKQQRWTPFLRILSRHGQMTLEVKGDDTHFQYQLRPKMHIYCTFGDSNSNSLQVIARTNQISSNSESKCRKWPWRPRSMISIFSISWECHRMHVCANVVIPTQICDESSCRQGKVHGRMDRRRQRQYPSAWTNMV